MSLVVPWNVNNVVKKNYGDFFEKLTPQWPNVLHIPELIKIQKAKPEMKVVKWPKHYKCTVNFSDTQR